jgi:hypothetical protein
MGVLLRRHLAEQAFGSPVTDGRLALPGVLSRKKQVVPPLAAALPECIVRRLTIDAMFATRSFTMF